MAWTNEQKEAIERVGENIMISAGAGSGKTAVLTSRVIHHLENGMHINEFLILTFTNAAAAEMKIRIQSELVKLKKTEELKRIDTSYITTFDSFALSLVKKYYYLLDLPKEIRITDSSIINLQKKKIMIDLLDRYYKNSTPIFDQLIKLTCSKDDQALIHDLLTLANKLEIKPDLDNYLDNYINNYYNNENVTRYLHTYEHILINKTEELLTELKNDESIFDALYTEKIKESFSLLTNNTNLDERLAHILVYKIPASPRHCENEIKEARERLNQILKELKSLAKYGNEEEIIKDYYASKDSMIMVMILLKEYYKLIRNYKKEQKVFDFSDIANYALSLVKEHFEIRNKVKNSFKEIMIDEYQDTSDYQETFIQYIQNNNVYMVGDIKQSIYRFRNANPSIFQNKYLAYQNHDGGLKIDLLKNFRSRKEVLEDINTIFNPIMDLQLGNANYINSHQMSFGNFDYEINKPNYNYHMELLNYTPLKEFSKSEIEFFAIGKDIKEKINQKMLIFDKINKKYNPVTYQDFTIIMDRNSSFEEAKKIFEYLGIPLSIYKDEVLNESTDLLLIKNIINLLIHLKEEHYNKDYRFAFLSVARSFLYGMNDDEIYHIFKENSFKDTKLYRDFTLIASRLYSLSIQEIIENVFEVTHFYERLITVGNVAETIERMEHLMNLADNLKNLNYDIYEFSHYLDELLKQDEQIKISNQIDAFNSVKLMNIHKSKGLEYPICYFCGLSKAFNLDDLKGLFIYETDLPISTPIFHEGLRNTFIECLIKQKHLEEDISEKIRLFYVALTRTREKMILLLPEGEDKTEIKDSNGVVINATRYHYHSLSDMINSIPNILKPYIKKIDTQNLSLSKDYLIPKEMNMDLEKELKPIVVHELEVTQKKEEELTFSKKTYQLITKEIRQNIEFGSLVHETLEFVNFKDFQEKEIDNNLVRQVVKNFIQQDIMKNVKAANIYQEYEFIFHEDQETYHGIIDLMLEYEDHVDIIDYKLDDISDAHYQKQLQGYKKYIETITQKKVSTYLYSILKNKVLELT